MRTNRGAQGRRSWSEYNFSNVGEIIPPYQTKQKEVGVKIDMGRITTTVSAFDITMPKSSPLQCPE